MRSKLLANGSTTGLGELRTFAPSPDDALANETPEAQNQPTELAEIAAQGGEAGLEALARLVQLANTGGEGFIDPTPLVEGILAARVSARSSGQYDLADELRDALTKAGVEVKDSPEGTTWSLMGVK